MPGIQTHSPEWFDDAFTAKTAVPSAIRNVATQMCQQFDIKGICDPLYISNVIAFELNVGDGNSSFDRAPVSATHEQVLSLSKRLGFSYSTCIAGRVAELTQILSQGLAPAPEGTPA